MPVLPIIVCRLTDRNGHILNPYGEGALAYAEMPLTPRRPVMENPRDGGKFKSNLVQFSI
jgi:hypothetical protein